MSELATLRTAAQRCETLSAALHAHFAPAALAAYVDECEHCIAELFPLRGLAASAALRDFVAAQALAVAKLTLRELAHASPATYAASSTDPFDSATPEASGAADTEPTVAAPAVAEPAVAEPAVDADFSEPEADERNALRSCSSAECATSDGERGIDSDCRDSAAESEPRDGNSCAESESSATCRNSQSEGSAGTRAFKLALASVARLIVLLSEDAAAEAIDTILQLPGDTRDCCLSHLARLLPSALVLCCARFNAASATLSSASRTRLLVLFSDLAYELRAELPEPFVERTLLALLAAEDTDQALELAENFDEAFLDALPRVSALAECALKEVRAQASLRRQLAYFRLLHFLHTDDKLADGVFDFAEATYKLLCPELFEEPLRCCVFDQLLFMLDRLEPTEFVLFFRKLVFIATLVTPNAAAFLLAIGSKMVACAPLTLLPSISVADELQLRVTWQPPPPSLRTTAAQQTPLLPEHDFNVNFAVHHMAVELQLLQSHSHLAVRQAVDRLVQALQLPPTHPTLASFLAAKCCASQSSAALQSIRKAQRHIEVALAPAPFESEQFNAPQMAQFL